MGSVGMWLLLGVVFFLILSRLVRWILTPVLAALSDPPALSYKHTYDEFKGDKVEKKPFPTILDKGTRSLSVIVPAKDEEQRLSPMMDEALRYLEHKEKKDPSFTYEVILVDDGSKDGTAALGMQYSKKFGSDKVRVCVLPKNQGKGGAVQQGMLNSRGHLLLMVDGDGATRFEDLDKLLATLRGIDMDGNAPLAMVIGSRAHIEDKAIAERAWYRNVLMHGLHLLVTVAVTGIRDTQCGFKLFTRDAACYLFLNQKLRRWSFDLELLHIAQRLSIPIREVAVTWTEIPGSKVNLLDASLTIARDLFLIRICYLLRIWKIHGPAHFYPKESW